MRQGPRSPGGLPGGAVGVAALVACLATGSVGPGAAVAQTPGPGGTERGWLGIGFQEVMECQRAPRESQRRCARKLVVAQLAVDGPADRAGVQPGDTLVALDGTTVYGPSPAGREKLFASVRPGEPVSLRLGRDGGRRTVVVTPDERPAALGSLRWRAGDRGAGVRFAPPPVAVRPAPSPAAPGGQGYVVRIQGDSGQVVRIHAVPEEAASESAVVRLSPDVAVAWRLEFGPGFEAIRDSALLRTRLRLDSLRSAYAGRWPVRIVSGAESGSEAESGGRAFVLESPLSDAPSPGERRLAGAEFEALDGRLAEYFEGADDGLLVLRVVPGTPADRVGLARGDVVVEAGGVPIHRVSQLRAMLAREPSGLRIRWVRKGRSMEGAFRER